MAIFTNYMPEIGVNHVISNIAFSTSIYYPNFFLHPISKISKYFDPKTLGWNNFIFLGIQQFVLTLKQFNLIFFANFVYKFSYQFLKIFYFGKNSKNRICKTHFRRVDDWVDDWLTNYYFKLTRLKEGKPTF